MSHFPSAADAARILRCLFFPGVSLRSTPGYFLKPLRGDFRTSPNHAPRDCRIVPIHRLIEAIDELPSCVVRDRGRNHAHVMRGSETAVIISECFECDASLAQKPLSGCVIAILRNGNDAHVMFGREGDESRQFLAAWCAPCGPEVEQRHRRAAKIDVDRGALAVSRTRRRAGQRQHQQRGGEAAH
jgi:hypothetical protein